MVKSWDKNWRNALVEDFKQGDTQWDMLIIGGGITGAGVAREAARRGLKTLLIEQRDFAWGTSSRSSKMVHGGLRYLTQGDFKLTHEAVVERQRMLDEAPGLVEPMKYVYAFRKGDFPNRWAFNFVMRIYDFFAGRRDYRYFSKNIIETFLPGLRDDGLKGGTQYTDAVTDDSRLVMRVLHEAQVDGAVAANYMQADDLIKENGKVVGVKVKDLSSGETYNIQSKVVVSATGAWADRLRGGLIDEKRVRPLRGSHIVVPSWRMPVHQALAYQHPRDGRFVFIYPWEGTTVVGTTDLDHKEDLDIEAGICQQELDYIIEGANYQFPKVKLTDKDVLATWSGVRPIVGKAGVPPEKINPSDATRDHVVWNNDGLITVTGGKLTTFRVIALDVLKEAASSLHIGKVEDTKDVVFNPVVRPLDHSFGVSVDRRLKGFYGGAIHDLLAYGKPDELSYIPGSNTLWAELRWSAGMEAVMHLDDLMLRRTRLGFLLPNGGLGVVDKIRDICCEELGWDSAKWDEEWQRYFDIWKSKYSLPA